MNKNSFKNFAEKMIFFMDNKKNHEEYSKRSFETAKFYRWDKVYKDLSEQLLKL